MWQRILEGMERESGVRKMNALIFVALLLIIGNVVCLYFFRWLPKNKYEVGDYVYTRIYEGLFVARIDSIVWESIFPGLIEKPVYNVYFFTKEKHARLSEGAILCKFKGERLIPSEENT